MSRSRDPADMIAPLKALPSQLLAQVLLHLQNVSKSPNSWMRFAANSVLRLWQQSMSSDRQGGSSKLQVGVWKNILHMCADISCFQRLLPCCLLLRDMLFDADTWTNAALDLTSLHMHVHVAPAFLAAMRQVFAKAAFVRVRYCHGEEFRGAVQDPCCGCSGGFCTISTLRVLFVSGGQHSRYKIELSFLFDFRTIQNFWSLVLHDVSKKLI